MATTYGGSSESALVRDLRAESRALGTAWLGLQDEVEQLGRHKSLLAREWRDLEEARERHSRERARFEKLVTQEWFPTDGGLESLRESGTSVKVNVGGQIFEVAGSLLLRDRFSLLAACCLPEEDSILRPGDDGCFFFDRDWFLFRHVLSYLQNGTLPKDAVRLRELYHEAGFYCLGSLQREIQTVLADMDDAGRDLYGRPLEPESPGNFQMRHEHYRTNKARSAAYRSGGHETARAASASRERRRREQSLVAPALPDPFGFTSTSASQGKKTSGKARAYYL